ncbi:NAD(P)-binding domain-containing protein [Nocardia sp. NBC_00565]|uniref:NAD(P)-binding domain-containing protein n=1 Tax=Nocardia sp. NBC_00565 TaxID=2975993 RepID=UPI002E808955|nr:NAD(P)-binding domain-containing protein [Nocardia sp. NBC_00565]WUC06473.1 NAD(P)-binding domain-containing protein [Nocardia sp. NBC_00565]
MPATAAVVVGAGHNGLAISRHLTERSIDHIVLERGQVAHSWRTQRWDSLRLLTPNWMTRLPGHSYEGDDPDGYLTVAEVADFITAYATTSSAPVETDTTVTTVQAAEDGFTVTTDQGDWQARTVVLAGGITTSPLPALAAALPDDIESIAALDYRNPDRLPDGGVLVVGAAASGIQIAEEVHRSGRPVTLATGEHVRAPRRYRDHDILWWLDATGILDQRWDQIDDIVRARNLASFQLVGGRRTIDFNTLQDQGIRLVGKLAGIRDGIAQFSGSLRNVITLADLKLNRLLDTIDEHTGEHGERLEPTRVPDSPLLLDLTSGEIRSVVWATGVEPDHSWLELPVFDPRGRLRHNGGVVDWPGLYVTGMPVLRRRRSTYIDGADADAADLTTHLAGYLRGRHPDNTGHRNQAHTY